MLTATPLIVMLVLSACNSTDAVLDPSSPPSAAVEAQSAMTSPAPAASEALAQPVAVTPAPAPQPPTLNAQAAVLSQNARVQFAPIVGATVEAVTPLTRRLSLRASQRGIALARSGDAATTNMMKGYFSAFSEAGETTVIYVWDILDPAGNRLHRIQGQEKATGVTAEGWAGVPSQTMEAVGDDTIDQLAAWLAARSG